jgi:endonuclease/exonuclease/phosphatase family metal-dependent hydrolase
MATPICVATWNVWWRHGPWHLRQDAILHELRRTNPDLCCLQEVWSESGTNLAQLLADDLGLACVFYPSADPTFYQDRLRSSDIGVGNAILSRWPIVRRASELLDAGDRKSEGRLVAFAEVETPEGALPVFTTQLNSGLTDSSIRVAQVHQVAAFMSSRAAQTLPPILAGDFNCEPDADEIRMITGRCKPPQTGFGLRDAWRLTRRNGSGATWSRRNPYVQRTPQLPDSRIDYVFVGYPWGTSDIRIDSSHLLGTAAVRGTWPSDHYGVCVNGFLERQQLVGSGIAP